jgi:hypothetical protein
MTTGYRAKSYRIAVGFPHSLVTANQAQKHFNNGALQRDFFRQMRFLLHGSGLVPVVFTTAARESQCRLGRSLVSALSYPLLMMIVRGKAKSVARSSSSVRTGFTNGTSPSTTSWNPPPPAREIRGTTLRLVGFRHRCENRGRQGGFGGT